MGFFKRLFSSKNREESSETEIETASAAFSGNFSTAMPDTRFQEDHMDPLTLDDCLKMIESYFSENNIGLAAGTRVNHPQNLDRLDGNDAGFIRYCESFRLDEVQAVLCVAYGFCSYLMETYGFRLYKDLEPDNPLQSMTLQRTKNGAMTSVYPFEYASKVLHGNETFAALDEQIREQIGDPR